MGLGKPGPDNYSARSVTYLSGKGSEAFPLFPPPPKKKKINYSKFRKTLLPIIKCTMHMARKESQEQYWGHPMAAFETRVVAFVSNQ